MTTIVYRAACPGCGRDVWWHATPITTDDAHRPYLAVKCQDCDQAEYAERPLEDAESVT